MKTTLGTHGDRVTKVQITERLLDPSREGEETYLILTQGTARIVLNREEAKHLAAIIFAHVSSS